MFLFNFFQVLFIIVSVLTLKQTSVVSNPEAANEETEEYLDLWKIKRFQS